MYLFPSDPTIKYVACSLVECQAVDPSSLVILVPLGREFDCIHNLTNDLRPRIPALVQHPGDVPPWGVGLACWLHWLAWESSSDFDAVRAWCCSDHCCRPKPCPWPSPRRRCRRHYHHPRSQFRQGPHSALSTHRDKAIYPKT